MPKGTKRESIRPGPASLLPEPDARGASAFYNPGQLRALQPYVARPEVRIHFADEHTSVWSDGWMQAALESGNRVAQEVNAAKIA